MGMYDNASFLAPNVNAVVPDLQNFLDYKKNREQERMANQINMEKDMANFQSNLRLKEMAGALDTQRIAESRKPLNVLPPTGLVTPAMDAQMQMISERNKLTDENNRMRNQIAQQNADTRRYLGEETLDTRRDIAGQNNETRTNIANSNNQSRAVRQDDQQAANLERDAARQTGRENIQNTRGQQIIKQIQERGNQDRLTKGTPTPNTSNSETQRLAGEKQRANQFRNENPNLAQWVNLDPNTGMVTVTPPSNRTSLFGGATGPTEDEYHRILGAIYNGGSNYSTGTPNSAPVTQVPTGGAAEIYVMKDGRRFKLNNPSQLDAALKQGYTQVK